MGTNYYQVIDPCECCGRGSQEIHIGKSSAGWPFSVHVMPELEIYSWADWFARLKGAVVKDEYGTVVSLEELNDLVISKRSEKDKTHVLESYEKYPHHARPCHLTGDQLISGDFS